MSQPTTSKKTWLWVFLIFALATVVKALLNAGFDDFKGEGTTYSFSAGDAKGRGVLVAELIADPPEVEVGGGSIRFGEAWLEERSLSTHCFVWFPVERRTGGYRLSFTLAEVKGLNASDLILVPDDAGMDARMSSEGRTIHKVDVDTPDISGLRLSVIRSWSEPRAKNIRFLPKQ